MIAALISVVLFLAAALTAVPVIFRLSPARCRSAALPAVAIAVSAATVAGYALLAHACIRDSCVAAAATVPVDCR